MILFCICCWILVGCNSEVSEPKPNVDDVSSVQALKAGIDALEESYNINSQEFRMKVHKLGSEWLMFVEFLPASPGAEVVVTIDRKGKVTIVPLI